MDDDDRASAGSLEAAAGGSDVEALSGDSFLNDDPATAADLDAIAGTLSDGDDGGSGRRQLGRRDDSNQALYAQETFLAGAGSLRAPGVCVGGWLACRLPGATAGCCNAAPARARPARHGVPCAALRPASTFDPCPCTLLPAPQTPCPGCTS